MKAFYYYLILCLFLSFRGADGSKSDQQSLQSASNDDLCFKCLIQNEFQVQQFQNKILKTGNFYSFCQFNGSSSCCLTSKDGTILDVNNQICMLGDCSHEQKNFDSRFLGQQYLFCNISFVSDQFCGSNEIILNQLSQPSQALQIQYDPFDQQPTNQTNSDNGQGNQTLPSSNVTNNTNQTNQTASQNQTGQVNGTNNSNSSTGNQTNGFNNTTNNSSTNNTTNYTQQANATNQSQSSNITNQTSNQTSNQILNNNQSTSNQSATNQTSLNQTVDSNTSKRMLQDVNMLRICKYQVKFPDKIVNQYNSTNEVMQLKLVQNNIKYAVYFLDQNHDKWQRLTDNKFATQIQDFDDLFIFGIFDSTNYVNFYLEYELEIKEVKNNNDDNNQQQEKDDGLKPIQIFIIIISIVAGVTAISIAVICIVRHCQKRQEMIRLQNEIVLEKQKDSMAQPVDLERNQTPREGPGPDNSQKRLSMLLISNEQHVKNRRDSKRLVIHHTAYNLTMDDLHKKSMTSKSQVTHGDGRKRSRDFVIGEMLKSGSLPRFGESISINKTDESREDNEEVDTNFGNLVRQSQKAMANSSKPNESDEASFKAKKQRLKSQFTKNLVDEDSSIQNNSNDNYINTKEYHSSEENDREIIQNDLVQPNEIISKTKTISEEEEDTLGPSKRRFRPQTAKLRDDKVFMKRGSTNVNNQSARKLRENLNFQTTQPHGTIHDELNQSFGTSTRNGGAVPKLLRGMTDVSNPRTLDPSNDQGTPLGSQRQHRPNMGDDIDYQHEDFRNKLQIFQSESKWEDYEYMDNDDISIDRPQVQGDYDEIEIKSAFHPDLKEQLQQTKIQKGILKNKNDNQQQQPQQKPKQTRKEKLIEEYQRNKDEDYYQNNNIVFNTGTFYKDDDEISDISGMTANYDRRNKR